MTEGDLKWIKNWQPQQIGNNMNRFYKKPKPETMKKNRELYRELYKDEIKWLNENFDKLQKHNKFLVEMLIILKMYFLPNPLEYLIIINQYKWSFTEIPMKNLKTFKKR